MIHELPDGEMRRELHRLGGTPAELLENDELMALMLPMLRADFEAVATYRHQDGAALDVPIVALGGASDASVTRDDLARWSEVTSSSFALSAIRVPRRVASERRWSTSNAEIAVH